MAKCVGSTTNWKPKINDQLEVTFLEDNVRIGELLIHKKLDETSDLILKIASDCNLLKLSAHSDGLKWNCSQVQDSLYAKLDNLGSQITSSSQKLASSSLISSTKHRYFILFACGVIEKLKQLLQIVGRLSELDQKLYAEEQNKPLISEESIVIHSLTTVWLAVISIMQSLIEPAREIFKEQLDTQEFSFIEQLDFSTAGPKHTRLLLMDLVITSWIQFNRLVKYDDLLKKLPFLCPCHCRTYLATLEATHKDSTDENFLATILPLIVDFKSKPSLITQNIRHHEIVPQQPFYGESDQSCLAYFVIWHIYSVSRIICDTSRHLIQDCGQLIEDFFDITIRQFAPLSQQETAHLSPHQEERFKLLFVMLDHLCEKNPKRLIIIQVMLSFFDKHWTQFGHYFDDSHFRIESLTIFQLFTKLMNDAQLLYNKEGQAMINATQDISKEEKELNEVWSRLLARTKPPEAPPATVA